MGQTEITGDELVRVFAALANPHRLRTIAALVGGRAYVSQLARDLGMSRPLLQVHLRRLEAVGLVSPHIEVSEDGKAMKFYEVAPFALTVTPEILAAAAATLTTDADGAPERRSAESRENGD
ncbi:ArsR family transcriptional regulator [Frankia sp. AgB1.8]|uniref:ArsR/SmtB family transcription factor n=1 Tax=Frankia sp. AgB1.8 TaxID=2792839 RepID=UPI0019333BAB|nr:ArsR family transcriptional regulator [Frankia sp. AgB1.8]MBL7624601.1 winged helix-turn-helix transcriptional regulator [Frankia sp. AgB1.8]